ncbi:A/G-specific adenine glycosylase [Novymonas esmeraldas]|uniref:Adenine DNA glycosylase n=1 Tax=Novymonas esmeraldas TaxID=1808958 RepID=A0AAW0EUS0_9TRYP
MPCRSACKPGARGAWRTPHGSPASQDYYRSVQEGVMEWWRQNQRQDLPWRRRLPNSSAGGSCVVATNAARYDPYQVWVCEVMSQQTRLDTVITYHAAWMKRFPSIEALAASTENDVKAVWAGMGYYRRAMYLRKGAQYLLEWSREHGAEAKACMPSSQQELLKVPGVGPYTAAAISSMCFGEPVCSVDGNVVRVLSRLRGEREFDPKAPASIKEATAWGQELMGNTPTTSAVVCQDPSALNQGLMELGASVCRPGGAPLCSSCPLQQLCCANALLRRGEIPAIEGIIPVRAAPLTKRAAREVSVVHELPAGDNGGTNHFVVVRRPTEGLLGGMLEFPTVATPTPSHGDETALSVAKHPLCTVSWRGAPPPISLTVCEGVRHIFSHIVLEVDVVHVRWPAGIDEAALLRRIAAVVDSHNNGASGNTSPAAARISLMSEAGLRESAPSRLMLKVLHRVSPSNATRARARKTSRAASHEDDAATSQPKRKTVKRERIQL